MSSPQHKKLRTSPSSTGSMRLDRISDLPGNVVDQILSCLPIKDATKTSILSREWRYKYVTIPDLVFNDRSYPLVRVVDHVLLLHSGPIHKFQLFSTQIISDGAIEKWILYLSRHHLQVLVLKMPLGMSFRMPSPMFSFENLRRLRITSCVLKPPSTFRGFKNLTELLLKDVVVDQDVLETMISSSPLLESFGYDGHYADHYLCIEAPNLLFLRIVTEVIYVSLKNTTRIQTFIFLAEVPGDKHINENYLKGILAGMPQLEVLSLGQRALKFIIHGEVSGKFFDPLVHLHRLSIHTRLIDVKETSLIMCMLGSASNLQQLTINFSGSKSLEASSKGLESDSLNRPFINLRYIKIKTFHATKAEMDFIGFMLSNSLALEKMVINFHAETLVRMCNDGHKAVIAVTNQLLSIQRGSPKATIIMCDK